MLPQIHRHYSSRVFWVLCLCAALQANAIPKHDGMALHYIDEVGTRDRTIVAGVLQ
jgi:hypothetical protein